ncbi:MAG: carboxypeptidase-like regulatory domain-containing protein [Vicinamibacterales bacterium]
MPRSLAITWSGTEWNMLRHLGRIAVCTCIIASVGCDGGKVTAPTPPPPPVEFGGRVVNADAGGPVEGVRVLVTGLFGPGAELSTPKNTATSGGDGTFTLPLNLPMGWTRVIVQLTGPPGYDDTSHSFFPPTAADRPAIGIYPILVIRPGESIDVRVESTINRSAFACPVSAVAGPLACRRVLVEASTGDAVELEIVPGDPSKPMGLTADIWDEEPVVRRMVAPGGLAYVAWYGADATRQGRLTAHR